jgi:hypothetical protein
VRYGVRHVLIQMESEHVSTPSCLRAMPLEQAGTGGRAQRAHKCLVLFQFPENFVAMVVQVGQGRVNLSKRKMRQAFGDFLGRVPMDFRLSINVLHADTSARNVCPRLPAAVRTKLDVCSDGLDHTISLRRAWRKYTHV